MESSVVESRFNLKKVGIYVVVSIFLILMAVNLKNLNKKIEDFLPSPNKVQSNHQRKQNLTTATNATSSVRQRSNLTKSNI